MGTFQDDTANLLINNNVKFESIYLEEMQDSVSLLLTQNKLVSLLGVKPPKHIPGPLDVYDRNLCEKHIKNFNDLKKENLCGK